MQPINQPTHPGEFVREDILIEFGMTQEQLATQLGVSRRTINLLVNEKRRVSADMALRLARFTNTSAELWLNLQTNLDLWDAQHAPQTNPINTVQPHPTVAA